MADDVRITGEEEIWSNSHDFAIFLMSGYLSVPLSFRDDLPEQPQAGKGCERWPVKLTELAIVDEAANDDVGHGRGEQRDSHPRELRKCQHRRHVCTLDRVRGSKTVTATYIGDRKGCLCALQCQSQVREKKQRGKIKLDPAASHAPR